MKLYYCSLATVLCAVNAEVILRSLNQFESAIVYSGNVAEVQRVVFVNETLSAKEYQTVNIRGFSTKTRDETVRIKGTDGSEILDFMLTAVRTTKLVPILSSGKKLDVTERIEKNEKDLVVIRSDKVGCDLELAHIDARFQLATNMVNLQSKKPNVTIEESFDVLNFYSKEFNGRRDAQMKLSIQQERLAAHIQNITTIIYTDKQLLTAVTREDKDEKELTFRFQVLRDVTPEHPLAFSISYMIPGASWSPEYDIRIESSKIPANKANNHTLYRMEIDYFANVWQNTDEHWVETDLTLSTSNPGVLNKHPEPIRKSVALNLPSNYQYGASALPSFARGFSTPNECPSARPSMQPSTQPSSQPSAQPSAQPSMQPSCAPSVAPTVVPSGTPSVMPMMASLGSRSKSDESAYATPDFLSSAAGSMSSSTSVSLGDVGASHMFQVPYPVNVFSKDLLGKEMAVQDGPHDSTRLTGYKHLILIEKVVLENTQLFTYAVPSQNQSPFLMGWGKYSNNCSEEVVETEKSEPPVCAVKSPLLASREVHVRIQGDNVGTIPEFEAVQPGQSIKLNLGVDKHIHITSSAVLPTHKGEEEDKSTWFVTDKKKYRVRTEERITTIRSSHATQRVLVIVSENLPRSTEEDDVSVELLAPLMADMKSLKTVEKDSDAKKTKTTTVDATGSVGSNNDEYLAAILVKENTRKDGSNGSVYHCKATGNVYWAQWVQPGETALIPFKYKIMWPEGKNVQVF